jgi:hypothetical protein
MCPKYFYFDIPYIFVCFAALIWNEHGWELYYFYTFRTCKRLRLYFDRIMCSQQVLCMWPQIPGCDELPCVHLLAIYKQDPRRVKVAVSTIGVTILEEVNIHSDSKRGFFMKGLRQLSVLFLAVISTRKTPRASSIPNSSHNRILLWFGQCFGSAKRLILGIIKVAEICHFLLGRSSIGYRLQILGRRLSTLLSWIVQLRRHSQIRLWLACLFINLYQASYPIPGRILQVLVRTQFDGSRLGVDQAGNGQRGYQTCIQPLLR